MAADAIRAGKHTLIEKPMAIDTAGIKAILEAVNDHPDVAVVEGSARHARLQPKFDFVRDFIQEGRLGEVYHIHHVMAQQGTFIEYNPDGAWAMNKATAGGGPVFDWGVYDLSFHLGILNDLPELVDIQGFSKNGLRDLSKIIPKTDIEQHAIALMTFDTGMTYYYERGAGLHMDVPSETRIYGTQGGLRFSYLTWESNQLQYFHGHKKPKQKTLKVSMKQHAAHDNLPLVENFLDCIEGKAAPAMRAELAAKHLKILMQITAQERALANETPSA
jgi:predicted dehydrogenase